MKTLLLTFLLLLPGSVQATDFTGHYSGDQLIIILEKDGTVYEGNIILGDQRYPLTAKALGTTLNGKFFVAENDFPFTASLKKNRLTLTTGGTSYTLVKKASVNPLTKSNNPLVAIQKNSQTSPTATPKKTDLKKYTHKTGLSFMHPKSWTVSATQQGINLLPSDAKKDAQGQPLEAFTMTQTPAVGINSIKDQRVTQFFDNGVQQMFGVLTRQGQPVYKQNGLGQGVIFTYKGTSQIGLDMSVGIYCVLHQNYALYLMHAAAKDLYPKRAPQALAVFTSLKMSSPQNATETEPTLTHGTRNPSLVGTWKRNESYYSAGYGGAPGAGSSTDLKLVFNQSGDVAYGTGTVVFGGNENVWANSGRGTDLSYGKWTSTQNIIKITWQDGSVGQYQYNIFSHNGGIAMKVIIDGTKKYFYKTSNNASGY